MKDKSTIVRFLLCAVLLAGVIVWGVAAGVVKLEMPRAITLNQDRIIKLCLLVFGVICIESLLTFILRHIKTKSHRARSVLSVLASILKYVAAIIILCWGLAILGVNLTTIAASVGIIALIIGFSAESLIADIVTGAFIIFENQYNVGDIIEVDGFRGTVTDIGIRTTSITDPAGNIKIINNSAMTNILNRSDHSSRAVATIGIPYETDLEALEEKIPGMMDAIFERHSDMLLSPPVYLGVDALADSSVNLKFVAEVEDKNIFSAARMLNRELFLGFRKAGVEVPFPQLDVHQK